METFRLFVSNNRFLESLSLDLMTFVGDTKGPPVDLPNLGLFSVRLCPLDMSAIIHIPTLQCLSSLRIYEGSAPGVVRLVTTGNGITLQVIAFIVHVLEAWEDLVGYARPTIRHVRLCNYSGCRLSDTGGGGGGTATFSLLADSHNLEVGRGYLTLWYNGFLDDLKRFGPQLKTIRFEVWEEMEPFGKDGYEDKMYGHDLLDSIEELVKYRFENGCPFSAVERLVVCESEGSNRRQDHVWRCFYNDRKPGQSVRPS